MTSLKRTSASAGRRPRIAPTPWAFLTNQAHVLICIAADANARIRDIAERVGLTERAIQKIISELEEAGYLTHVREGRRNVYRVRGKQPLRHPLERHRNVAGLIALVVGEPKRR